MSEPMNSETLAEILSRGDEDHDLASVPIAAAELRFVSAEVDRLRAELAGRRAEAAVLADARLRMPTWHREHPDRIMLEAILAHIDWQDAAIHDLMSEDAAVTLREQGAAEERTRITDAIREMAGHHHDERVVASTLALACVTELYTPLPDLLPPTESRRLVAEAERKVAALREAMMDVALRLNPHADMHELGAIASSALEATR